MTIQEIDAKLATMCGPVVGKMLSDSFARMRAEKAARKESGWVYLATDGASYKVGRSIHPDKRVKSLKSGNPNPVYLFLKIKVKDSVSVEKSIHRHLESQRACGEWFNLTKQQLKTLVNMMADIEKKEAGQ